MATDKIKIPETWKGWITINGAGDIQLTIENVKALKDVNGARVHLFPAFKDSPDCSKDMEIEVLKFAMEHDLKKKEDVHMVYYQIWCPISTFIELFDITKIPQ